MKSSILLKKMSAYVLTFLLVFSSTVVASAETTGSWEQVAPLQHGRYHSVSVVLDNKIYSLSGDGAPVAPDDSVEEFDPKTNTWTPKAPMNVKKLNFAAVVVNGKIYALGGINEKGDALRGVDEYDPATNVWTEKQDGLYAAYDLCAVVMNGKIYALGGRNGSAGSQVSEYDPATNTWTRKASMHLARTEFSAEVLGGKIYVFGGSNNANFVEAYDPGTDKWEQKADMPGTQDFETVVVDNKVYTIGGSAYDVTKSVEAYDPETNTWAQKAPMITARAAFQAIAYNGKIYAFGGSSDTKNRLSSMEMYDVKTDKWQSGPSMLIGKIAFNSVLLNGTIYAIGGMSTTGQYSDVESYKLEYSPTLTVTASPNKVKVGQKFTTEIAVHNGTNICAEDIQVKYDNDLFQYEGTEAETGLKIYKEDKSTPGVLRFIVASEGKDNAATGDKNLFHLNFTAKKAGTGKVDITKGRIADNATLEMDVADADCGEDTITVEATKDVNRTGEYTLLDLGIDAWYNGMNASDTDSTKYDADVVVDGKIDDNDLAEVTAQILGNSNYAPNSYQ